MSFSDLTLYMLDTLQAYFGAKGTNPDPNLTVEQSVASTDPFSSLAPGVNQKVILIDAPVTKESSQQASGQVYDFTDNIRLTLFIRLMTADTDANTAFTMVETLRQAVIQAVNARKGKLGVANVKLVSAPKPTMSDNTVSDTMTYEIHHFEDSFTGPNAPVSIQNAPSFAVYPGVDGKTLDTFGALGTIEVAHIGIQTANIAPAAVTANQVDGSVEVLSHKGVMNGYASLDGTGKVPAAQIPASVSYPGPDNITIDGNGAGGTLEVKAGGVGAAQVNSQIEQTANRDQTNGYAGISGGKILGRVIPVDNQTIALNTANQLAVIGGGGGGGFPGVDNVTIDQVGGVSTGLIEVKNNSIGPSQVTPVIEQTTNKDHVNGYPGLDANALVRASEIPVDGTTIVVTGTFPNQKIQAQASGGYPGVDNSTLDTGGAGGTIEIKASGVTNSRIANSAVNSSKVDGSVEITANKNATNGYVGLTSGKLNATQVPIDSSLSVVSGNLHVVGGGGTYPGVDGATLDTGGAGGTIEVKAGGIGATQVNSQIQVTSQINHANGYCGLDSNTKIPISIPLANASQVPVDGTTVTTTGGVLHAVAGGTFVSAYVPYNVLVQPRLNNSNVAQPMVVDSAGVAIVQYISGHAQIVDVRGSSSGSSTGGFSATSGIQEAIYYLQNTNGLNQDGGINGGVIHIAANNQYITTYGCTASISIPSASTGITIQGAGTGGVNAVGGSNSSTHKAGSGTKIEVTGTITTGSLIQFGSGGGFGMNGSGGTGYANGCTIKDIYFQNITHITSSKCMCDFGNNGNGDEAAGNTFDNLTFFSSVDNWDVTFNHNDDSKVWNCRFYGGNVQWIGNNPSQASVTPGYNSFDVCHFNTNAIVNSQGMGFHACTFRSGATVTLTANGRNVYTFDSCFFDDTSNIQTSGGTAISIQCIGVMFGQIGSSAWIFDSGCPSHLTAIGCNFNPNTSNTTLQLNHASTLNMIDCSVGSGGSMIVSNLNVPASFSPVSGLQHIPAFWGN